jgi:uncharacterized membrane protein
MYQRIHSVLIIVMIIILFIFPIVMILIAIFSSKAQKKNQLSVYCAFLKLPKKKISKVIGRFKITASTNTSMSPVLTYVNDSDLDINKQEETIIKKFLSVSGASSSGNENIGFIILIILAILCHMRMTVLVIFYTMKQFLKFTLNRHI